MRRPLITFAFALIAVACAPEASGDATVDVELADAHVVLDPETVTAGRIVFETVNTAATLVHEIEVFSGATAGAVLPVDNSVADTTGLTLVDEIEDIVPGATATLTVDLTAGTYLVVCNLPDHYELGMWAYLTVTP